jgi:hypothetical protein
MVKLLGLKRRLRMMFGEMLASVWNLSLLAPRMRLFQGRLSAPWHLSDWLALNPSLSNFF